MNYSTDDVGSSESTARAFASHFHVKLGHSMYHKPCLGRSAGADGGALVFMIIATIHCGKCSGIVYIV